MHYEGMFVLHNRELPEGENAGPEEVVRQLVGKAGGAVVHAQIWANRKLAYPIAGNQTGTYVLAYFSGEGDVGNRLNHEIAITDRCLRHLVLAIEAIPETPPGPLAEPGARPPRRADGEGAEGEEGAEAEGDEKSEPRGEDDKDGPREKKVHEQLDYKSVHVLRRMVTSQGKLFSRVRSNLHAKEQRRLRRAVIRARQLALLPFVSR